MKAQLKTLIASALASGLMAAVACPASAQTTNHAPAAPVPAPGLDFRDSRAKFGPMPLLSQSLNLNEQQARKLEPIFKEQQAQMTALRRNNTLSRQQKMAAIRQIAETANTKLMAVLTPEQAAEFQRIRTNYQATLRHQLRPQRQAPQ